MGVNEGWGEFIPYAVLRSTQSTVRGNIPLKDADRKTGDPRYSPTPSGTD